MCSCAIACNYVTAELIHLICLTFKLAAVGKFSCTFSTFISLIPSSWFQLTAFQENKKVVREQTSTLAHTCDKFLDELENAKEEVEFWEKQCLAKDTEVGVVSSLQSLHNLSHYCYFTLTPFTQGNPWLTEQDSTVYTSCAY